MNADQQDRSNSSTYWKVVDDIETKDNDYKRERFQRKIERGKGELFHGKKQSLWVSCNTLLRTHSLSRIHEEGMIRPLPLLKTRAILILQYRIAKLRREAVYCSPPTPYYSVKCSKQKCQIFTSVSLVGIFTLDANSYIPYRNNVFKVVNSHSQTTPIYVRTYKKT
jgi:hypothetical protein